LASSSTGIGLAINIPVESLSVSNYVNIKAAASSADST
jgi:hypothetical protein